MNEVILTLLVAVLGGIMGGMGMGGGTLLIPLLTALCSVSQHSAQGLNLIAFLPMSVLVLVIHAKNGLVDFKSVLPVVIPASAASLLASILALKTDGEVLKRAYGIFLILLGAYLIVSIAVNMLVQRLSKEENKYDFSKFPNKF